MRRKAFVLERELCAWTRRMARVTALLTIVVAGASPCASSPASVGAATPVTGAARSFYLSNAAFGADEAVGACARGYHMASLSEIHDVSGLRYAHDHPAARSRADSGGGPPAGLYGWVRTGRDGSAVTAAGIGNCQAWTSTDVADSGTVVSLPVDWSQPATRLDPWDGTTLSCVGAAPAWCVSVVPSLDLFIADDAY